MSFIMMYIHTTSKQHQQQPPQQQLHGKIQSMNDLSSIYEKVKIGFPNPCNNNLSSFFRIKKH
jgi:hypothetical protein